jgi:hypothetical protein
MRERPGSLRLGEVAKELEELVKTVAIGRKEVDQPITVAFESPAHSNLEIREAVDVEPVGIHLDEELLNIDAQLAEDVIEHLAATCSPYVVHAGIEREASDREGCEKSADAIRLIEGDHVEALLCEIRCGGKAARPRPDHDRIVLFRHGRQRSKRRATRARSSRGNGGIGCAHASTVPQKLRGPRRARLQWSR